MPWEMMCLFRSICNTLLVLCKHYTAQANTWSVCIRQWYIIITYCKMHLDNNNYIHLSTKLGYENIHVDGTLNQEHSNGEVYVTSWNKILYCLLWPKPSRFYSLRSCLFWHLKSEWRGFKICLVALKFRPDHLIYLLKNKFLIYLRGKIPLLL